MTDQLLESLIPAVRAAGVLIEEVRTRGFETRGKTDASPVTEADERAELLLTAAIRALDDAPIVGEEAHAAGHRPDSCARFWLVDALDGTKDFIAGRPAYSVNVALVDRGVPILGLVLSPRDGMLWAGSLGRGAFRQAEPNGPREPLLTRPLQPMPVVVVSHSHMDPATAAWVDSLGQTQLEPAGSSLKFCRLAEGSADVYPRYGPTCEWDTAAGHAVLLAAGGAMRDRDGREFGYGKADYFNGGFLAVGDPAAFEHLPAL
ncbi:3'(2'),5'-bisphosphate nucleotidase CysQ [Glacieibacterium sp.]|uniref:3'(2'),5'-bisphosphate nucleotidase CysQ n=1 Tax=Glacieibacterium sp. TaxID=2860237 RepID=UPI003B003C73